MQFFSTTECTKRQKLAKPEYAAQWTIGPSACIQALAKAKMKLVEHIKKIKIAPPETEAKLKEIDIMLAHFINHSLAMIAGFKDFDLIRASGLELPERYNIMESYQAVTDITGKIRWLPGDNTRAWTAAQLYDGLMLALKAEKELDLLVILNMRSLFICLLSCSLFVTAALAVNAKQLNLSNINEKHSVTKV